MRLMRLVLSSPMSGRPDFGFAQLDDARDRLVALGYEVQSPADMDRERGWVEEIVNPTDWNTVTHTDRFDYETAMQACLDEIGASDGIVLLDGWDQSPGCLRELAEARRLGKRVFRLVANTLYEMGSGEIVSQQNVPAAASVDWAGLRERLDHLMDETKQDEEVRVTDPVTGGQKGRKLAQLGCLDPLALLEVAKVAGFGAQKYERYNFLKGYDWSLSFDAKERHALQFWAGEDRDDESGLYHLAHEAWHCLTLMSFLIRGLGTDDRYKP